MKTKSRLAEPVDPGAHSGFETVRYGDHCVVISGTAKATGQVAAGTGPSVALVTPWKQVCGNARYAEKLAVGLSQFADVVPVTLEPAPFGKGHFEAVVAQIRRARPDVVHIQHEYCFFGSTIPAANRQLDGLIARIDAPVVLTLHTIREDLLATRSFRWSFVQPFYTAFTKVLHKLNRRGTRLIQRVADRATRRFDALLHALSRCQTIVVHSEVSAQYLKNAHPELAAKIKVIPIPVPSPPPPRQAPLVKPADEVWLMMLGFVSEYKGHLAAIEALPLLPANYRLVVAGGRHPHDSQALDYWSRLLGAIDALRLRDRVTFTGFVADEGEYAATLALADAFLLPYQEVGQSASAVLADVMSFGKPVVTSTARSMFEYRYERDSCQSAFAADVEDAVAFAAQIEFALEESRRPGASFDKHMQHARRSCSLESVASRYEQVYRTARRVA